MKRAVKDFMRVMKALSDPTRIKIVKMFQQREMCVCEMQETLGLAQPMVSKHLKILHRVVQSKTAEGASSERRKRHD